MTKGLSLRPVSFCVCMGSWALLGSACKDVTRFSTGPGEYYCGAVVEGPLVRDGFGPAVNARMTFDADHINDPKASPGAVSTHDFQTGEELLREAPLRVIAALNSDPLSTLEFGDGRDRNVIYMVDPADPGNGPTITAVVSLLHSGGAELRLVRGAALPDGTSLPAADGKPLFGVFPLQLQTGTCNF